MSNANEEIEMPEMDENEVRSLLDFLHIAAISKGPITVGAACANFLCAVIASVPLHDQEAGIEALVRDLRASIKDRNEDRLGGER